MPRSSKEEWCPSLRSDVVFPNLGGRVGQAGGRECGLQAPLQVEEGLHDLHLVQARQVSSLAPRLANNKAILTVTSPLNFLVHSADCLLLNPAINAQDRVRQGARIGEDVQCVRSRAYLGRARPLRLLPGPGSRALPLKPGAEIGRLQEAPVERDQRTLAAASNISSHLA